MRIIISEEQFKHLIESELAPNFNGGDLHEYPGSEVSPTANVTKPNGEEEYGKPMNTGTDRVAKKMSVQNNYINGRASVSYTS